MTFNEILDRLETSDPSDFQREALQEAIKIQADITPALLDIIEFSANNPNWLEENYDYMGFSYALYLLAHFREKRAFPLIIKYVSKLGKEVSVLDATGDIITEDLSRVLVSVYDGNLEPIQRVIENPELNEYVRSATLESLVILYKHEFISRIELLDYFSSLIDEKLERCESYIWSSLANSCCDIHPEEMYDDLMKCFDQGYISPEDINKEDINYYQQLPKEQVIEKLQTSKRLTMITDVFESMQWWACFNPQKTATKKYAKLISMAQSGGGLTAQKRLNKKVGRNDPCPCGSGKKYKKCCLH